LSAADLTGRRDLAEAAGSGLREAEALGKALEGNIHSEFAGSGDGDGAAFLANDNPEAIGLLGDPDGSAMAGT
jgi:hypothetical protein